MNTKSDKPETNAKSDPKPIVGQRQRSSTSPSTLAAADLVAGQRRTTFGPNVSVSSTAGDERMSRWSATAGQPLAMDTTTVTTQSLGTSLYGFQMPQNYVLQQMIPNYPSFLPNLPSMASFHDYLPTQMPTLPTVSMPSMPSMPALSMPNISIPSMPNISIPSMPNLPSIPSFTDFMNSFPSRKPTKPWPQLRQAVKNSHRRFSEIGCKVPFLFNWREDPENKRLRIYFLSSINNSADITLVYCDIETDPNAKQNSVGFDISTDVQQIETNLNKEVVIEDCNEELAFGSDEEFMPMSDRRSESRRKTSDISPKALWRPLITSNKPGFPFDSDQSSTREENLQLERKRIMFSGITSYEYQPKSSRFVFTSGDTLYWFDDPLEPTKSPADGQTSEPRKGPPYTPQKLESTTSFCKMNPQLCPSDENLVAYVADGDLWVCNLKSGLEFRLTETTFESSSDSSVVSAGLPSYVIQEEFRRYTGFWWRPDNEFDHIENNGDPSYSILCEFVDESEVEVVKIASWDGNVEEYRFPRPGQCNAESSLSIVTFSLNPSTNIISDVKISSLPKSLNEIFPSFEYLVRCGWHSYDAIWLQLLDRSQSHLVLVLMSLHDLFPPQILYEEKADKWINCHDILHFFSSNEYLSVGSTVRFIWSSEESGFRHLYKIEVQLVGCEKSPDVSESRHTLGGDDKGCDAKLPKLDKPEVDDKSSPNKQAQNVSEESGSGVATESATDLSSSLDSSAQFSSIETLRSKLVSKKQLTLGNWEVSDKEVWFDETNQLIYFTGLKESPLERHLYVISLNYPKLPPKRLTIEDFSHTTIAFNSDHKYFVDIQSNITIPPFGYLQKITTGSSSLPDTEMVRLFLGSSANPGEDSDQIDLLPGMAAPQLFDYRLKSGDLIYGFIFKPECMEAGVRYPVLLEVYGGPEVQLVSKSFKAVRHCRRHLLASEGYIVVAFDSRGSKHRGVTFESHCYRRLGQIEIADQVEALQWLAENTDFIDMSRIAVHGWSYGGYLSLMALAQRPDIFKCAIAGAPVTNWQLYDTGYTERYMGTPEDNPEGYRMGNVISHINSFPNEENRLLIIHGLMDENVHFAHSVQLIQALVKAGKPYQLNVYPFERHSLRQSGCSEHYETLLLSFLQNNL